MDWNKNDDLNSAPTAFRRNDNKHTQNDIFPALHF